MSVYVFTGPTLPADDARNVLDAIYLPPVCQGDVYRVILKNPSAIGIIDGYFERVPAVWHKEILWAMSRGIHVYGSASMGALRAAELVSFGMVGVGAIFEAYGNGALEDDDEVAVAHGPADTGYRPLSVAMVNVRFTLVAAEEAGVIGAGTRAKLESIAKNLFYPDRSYPRILERAAAQGVRERELRPFREWLPRGAIDQKRTDALTMLGRMRELLATAPEPKRVTYTFEYTEMWDYARRHAGELDFDEGFPPGPVLLDGLLEELRLEGAAQSRARQGALSRFLALEEAWRLGMVVSPQMLESTTDAFRREHGLADLADVERWMREQHLDHGQFARLIEDEARLRLLDILADREVVSHLPDYLRATGEYGRLVTRARDKQHVLESSGLDDPDVADAGLTEQELMRWYFETRLGRPVAPDVAAYARSVSFEDERAFRRAVLREFCYGLRRA